MRQLTGASLIVAAIVLVASPPAAQTAAQAKPNPVLVLETAKGAIEIEFFAAEAPKSVEHIVGLAKSGFYRAQRFHRVTDGLVQWGDKKSRDVTLRNVWGTGSNGTPIGVFELSKKRSHIRGAVALAHSGNPAGADSQLYIMKSPSPGLDGKHAVIGRVTVGMAVVDKIAVADVIKNTTVK